MAAVHCPGTSLEPSNHSLDPKATSPEIPRFPRRWTANGGFFFSPNVAVRGHSPIRSFISTHQRVVGESQEPWQKQGPVRSLNGASAPEAGRNSIIDNFKVS